MSADVAGPVLAFLVPRLVGGEVSVWNDRMVKVSYQLTSTVVMSFCIYGTGRATMQKGCSDTQDVVEEVLRAAPSLYLLLGTVAAHLDTWTMPPVHAGSYALSSRAMSTKSVMAAAVQFVAAAVGGRIDIAMHTMSTFVLTTVEGPGVMVFSAGACTATRRDFLAPVRHAMPDTLCLLTYMWVPIATGEAFVAACSVLHQLISPRSRAGTPAPGS